MADEPKRRPVAHSKSLHIEHNIPLKEVLKLTHVQPLFGHPSGKHSKTHWVAFIK
jgi:hypothetical protein